MADSLDVLMARARERRAKTAPPADTLDTVMERAKARRGAGASAGDAPPAPFDPAAPEAPSDLSEPEGLAGIPHILKNVPGEVARMAMMGAGTIGTFGVPQTTKVALMRESAEDVERAHRGDQAARHRIGARQLALSATPLGGPTRLARGGLGVAAYAGDVALAGDPFNPAEAVGAFALGAILPGAKPRAVRAAAEQARAAITQNIPPVGDAVSRVRAAIEAAPRVYGRQEGLRTIERRTRVARAVTAAAGTHGERAARAILHAHTGELPRVNFRAIVDQLEPGDMDELFEQIVRHPHLSEYDRLPAISGLYKILGRSGGEVPVPSEIAHLKTVFGGDFVKTLMDKRSTMQKLADEGHSLINVPRALQSMGDLSGAFRQGLFLISKPREFGSAFMNMFRYAGSERAFNELNREIQSRKTFPAMQRAGLFLADVGSDLSRREEGFMTRNLERLPLFKGSQRAYVGFLNKLRADTFDSLVRDASRSGLFVLERTGTDAATRQSIRRANNALLGDIANFVNTASGRGDLGKLEGAVGALNATLFSPRLIASRLKLLNPYTYLNPATHPFVRREYIKSLLSVSGLVATVGAMTKAAGGDMSLDPESPNFLKARFGRTRYDLTGGAGNYIRAGVRLITRTDEILKSEQDRPSALRIGGNFARSKLSPPVSFAVDALLGSDYEGRPFGLPRAAIERLTPMVSGDIVEAVREYGPAGLAVAAPSVFGVTTQTYQE